VIPLLSLVFAAPPDPEVPAGLFEVGEPYGAGTVAAVELHAEYQRISVDDGERTLWEVTTGTGGICDHGGLTVFPRPELVQGPTGHADPSLLCERLAARPPGLRSREHPAPAPATPAAQPVTRGGSAGEAEAVGATRTSWVNLLVVAVILLGLYRARPDRTDLGLALLGLLARLLLSPAGIVNGDLGGQEKLLLARATMEDPPYGLGWGALMGFVPAWPDGVFVADLLLAVLAVPLAGRVARLVAGQDARWPAGLFLAFLPVHLAVSRSETMHVSVTTLEVLSVLAAIGAGRSGRVSEALLSAAAAGLAMQIRPDALVFAPVPLLGMMLGTNRRVPLTVASVAVVGLIAARLSNLHPEGAGGLLRHPTLEALLPRFGPPRAESSFLVSLHLGLTPPVLVGLAGLGALGWGARRRAEVGLLVIWAALATIPFAGKVFPLADAIRFQLAGQVPLVVLAGVAAASLPRMFTVSAVFGAWTLLLPERVQTEEWNFVRTLPPVDGPVQFDPRHVRAAAWVAVMNRAGAVHWTTEPSIYRYIGLTCLSNGGCDTSGCIEVVGHTLTGAVDVDLRLRGRRLSLVRCAAADPDWGSETGP
jgi:hypothetical protein